MRNLFVALLLVLAIAASALAGYGHFRHRRESTARTSSGTTSSAVGR